jgi:hypothetical protein
MSTDSNTQQQQGGPGFLIGFMAGALVATAVAIWLTPQSAPIRRKVTRALKDLGTIGDDVESAGRAAVAEIKKHVSV